MGKFVICAFLVVVTISAVLAGNHSDANTQQQIHQLRENLRDKIYPNNSFVNQFIKDDLYILRFLEHNGNNVTQTERHFMYHLEWRSSQKIDNIHLEDWSEFQKNYPQFLNGTDKLGRPVAEIWFSDWDIKSSVNNGKLVPLVRWATYLLEMSQRALYTTRAGNGTKNVIGVVNIVDVQGFNTQKHGCIPCTPFFIRMGAIANQHYPKLVERTYMVNVGPFVRSFFGFLSNNFLYTAGEELKMYSGNKNEWLAALDKDVAKDQRSTRFGGSVKRL